MTTSRKILVTVAAVVIVGLVALIVLAKILITPERVKEVLLPRVEQALNRQVSIEQIEISLFSGIALKKMTILEPGQEEVFLSTDTMNLRYRFWPLFLMRVEIDEISLERPQIRLVRFADGSFNFSDLMKTAPEEEGSDAPEASSAGTDAETGEGIDLLISELAIRSGAVLFLDHQAGAESARHQIEELSLQIDEFSLEQDFPVSLSAVLNGAPLALKGQANLASGAADLEIGVSGLDVMPFAPYIRDQLPGLLEGGILDLALRLSRQQDRLSSEGQVSIRDLDLTLEALPEAPLKKARISSDYKIQFNPTTRQLQVEHGKLALNGVPVYVDGEIQLAEKQSLNLNLRLNELNIADALSVMPAGLVKELKAIEPSGLVTARVHLKGAPEQPKELLRDGELRLDDVQARVGDLRPAVNGLITLRGDSLFSENLILSLAENRLQLECEAHSLMSFPVVAVVNIRSDRLVVDSLIPQKTASEGVPSSAPASASEADPEQTGKPLDLPLTLTGTANISQVVYRGLDIDDLQARYRLKNNLLEVYELTGRVAGGSFRNSASIDLGRPGYVYQAQLTTSKIQADPLVSAFVPKAAGTVFGLLNLDLDLAGQGTDMEVLRRQLTGKGELLLKEGRLTGSTLLKGLASFLGLPELGVMGFDQALGRFAINQGRVDLSSTLTSQDLRLAPQGDVGLDGTLDLALDLRLSPDLTQKLDRGGQFAQLLVDAEGWGQIPLKVRGSVTQPRFALDSAMVREALKEKAGQKLQETLEKKLFKKEPADGEEDPDQKEKKLLEGVLKGLFGQ